MMKEESGCTDVLMNLCSTSEIQLREFSWEVDFLSLIKYRQMHDLGFFLFPFLNFFYSFYLLKGMNSLSFRTNSRDLWREQTPCLEIWKDKQDHLSIFHNDSNIKITSTSSRI